MTKSAKNIEVLVIENIIILGFYWSIFCQNNKERIHLTKHLTFLLYIHGK